MAKLVPITWPLLTYRVPLVKCLIAEDIFYGHEHACDWIYPWFLSESIETNSRETFRIAFESPRNCFWVTWELPLSHLARKLRWRQLGITFESFRNHVWMTSIAKLVAITWPLVANRVPPVNFFINEVIPHGPGHELACVWIYITVFVLDYRDLLKRCPQNCIWVTSELLLRNLRITFESPRNYVWMTLMAKLAAIFWPLVTYCVPLVECLITEVIPNGPGLARVWINISDFYQRPSKHTEEMTSELHLAQNCYWNNSELRFSHLEIMFESPSSLNWLLLLDHL